MRYAMVTAFFLLILTWTMVVIVPKYEQTAVELAIELHPLSVITFAASRFIGSWLFVLMPFAALYVTAAFLFAWQVQGEDSSAARWGRNCMVALPVVLLGFAAVGASLTTMHTINAMP